MNSGFKTKFLGRVGVWLCDRFQPRPCTKGEIAQSQQYAGLMIETLRGTCAHYGRDRDKGSTPFIAERREYKAVHGS